MTVAWPAMDTGKRTAIARMSAVSLRLTCLAPTLRDRLGLPCGRGLEHLCLRLADMRAQKIRACGQPKFPAQPVRRERAAHLERSARDRPFVGQRFRSAVVVVSIERSWGKRFLSRTAGVVHV